MRICIATCKTICIPYYNSRWFNVGIRWRYLIFDPKTWDLAPLLQITVKNDMIYAYDNCFSFWFCCVVHVLYLFVKLEHCQFFCSFLLLCYATPHVNLAFCMVALVSLSYSSLSLFFVCIFFHGHMPQCHCRANTNELWNINYIMETMRIRLPSCQLTNWMEMINDRHGQLKTAEAPGCVCHLVFQKATMN